MERLARILKKFDELFGPSWFTVLFTNTFAVFFIVTLVWIGRSIGSDFHARLLNYMLIVLGALSGWALGMFFAPYGEGDKEALAQMSKLASVFVTGYAVSKIDRFVEASVFVGSVPDPVSWIRIGLFAGATVLSILVVVTNRIYFRPGRSKSEQTASGNAKPASLVK